jgi:hypothetical protein
MLTVPRSLPVVRPYRYSIVRRAGAAVPALVGRYCTPRGRVAVGKMVSGGVTFASVTAVCLVVLPSVVAQAPVSGDCAVFSTVRPPPPADSYPTPKHKTGMSAVHRARTAHKSGAIVREYSCQSC